MEKNHQGDEIDNTKLVVRPQVQLVKSFMRWNIEFFQLEARTFRNKVKCLTLSVDFTDKIQEISRQW